MIDYKHKTRRFHYGVIDYLYDIGVAMKDITYFILGKIINFISNHPVVTVVALGGVIFLAFLWWL